MTKPEPYRPPNGTEGALFLARWCSGCQRERAYIETPETAGGCNILTLSYALDINDPDYPREWVYGPDEPICTAFVPYVDEAWPFVTIQHPNQLEMPLCTAPARTGCRPHPCV